MRNTLLTTTAALLLAAAPAFASGDVAFGDVLRGDVQATGWDAWYGCWMAAGDEETTDDAGTALVCVLPGADAQTARIANVEDGRIVDELSITADGQPRAFDNGGCTGTEMARFSADGRRVYTRADLDCRSFQRVSTGVIAMVSPTEWVETQGVTVSGQATGRTVRYHAVPASAVPASIRAQLPAIEGMALEAVRLDAAVPLDVDAVIEAADAVGGPALEALLAVRQQEFDLDARSLTRLSDGGVPGTTIDVMIALSYPDKFAVRESSQFDDFGQRAGRNAELDEYCDYMYRSARRPVRRGYYGYGSGYECDDMYGMNYGYNSMYGNRNGYGMYDRYRWGRSPVIVEEVVQGGTVTREGYTRGDAPVRGTARRRSGSASQPASRSSAGARSTPTTTSRPTPTPPAEPPRRAKPRPPGGGGGG